jgi:hypothetical protein
VVGLPIPLIFVSAFRDIADMAGPADRFASVENDPERSIAGSKSRTAASP